MTCVTKRRGGQQRVGSSAFVYSGICISKQVNCVCANFASTQPDHVPGVKAFSLFSRVHVRNCEIDLYAFVSAGHNLIVLLL